MQRLRSGITTNALYIGILVSCPLEKTVTMFNRFNAKMLAAYSFFPNFAYGKLDKILAIIKM